MKDLSQSTMAQANQTVCSSLLKKASLAFIAKDFESAAATYRVVLDSLTSGNNEKYCLKKNVVKYMLCISLIESKKLHDLQEALRSLRDLISEPNCFPMAFYALAKMDIKFFRFDYALKTIHKGFAFLNKDNELQTYYIPETNHNIPESSKKGLLEALYKLQAQCLSWHRPDALCNMTDCQNHTELYPPDRNIYFSDPAFTGVVTVMCNNPMYACALKFHKSCWEYKKKQIGVSDLTDEEMIGHKCVTPNCKFNRIASTITKIEFFDNANDSKDVIEDPGVLKQSLEDSVAKGAIKKQRNSDKETYCNNDTTEVQEPDWGADFRSEDEATAQLKSFSFGLLFSFIETNGPLTTEEVLKKWDETRMIIPNSDSILNDHKDIIDFLVQSPNIFKVQNYLCVEGMLSQVHNLLKSNKIKQFSDVTSIETYEDYRQTANVDIRNDGAVARDSVLTNDQPQDNEFLHQIEHNINFPKYKKEERNNNNDYNNGGNPANDQSYTTQGQLYNRPQRNSTSHQRLRLPTYYFEDIKNDSTAANKTGNNSGSINEGSPRHFHNTYNEKDEIIENHNNVKTSADSLTSGPQSQDTYTTKQNNNTLNHIDDTNVCGENIEEVENNNTPSDKMFDLLVKEFISMIPTNNSLKAKQKLSVDHPATPAKPVVDSPTQKNCTSHPATPSKFVVGFPARKNCTPHQATPKSVVDPPTQKNCTPLHRNANGHSNQCTDTPSGDTTDELTTNQLKLLLKEKDSKIESLTVQNEMLRAGLKNAQSYSKTIIDKCTIMQQNEAVLKKHVDVLLQEKHDSENNIKLLMREKWSVTNSSEDRHELLLTESATHETQLKQKDGQLNGLKLELFNLKKNMLQKLLDSRFIANTAFIMRNVELCNTCIAVVDKLNDMFQRNFGFAVLSDNVEWSQALNGFHRLSTHNQSEYQRIKSLLESREHIEETTDIVLSLVDIPRFPTRSLVELVGDAFGKYMNMTKTLHQQQMARTGLGIPYQPAVQHHHLPVPQNHPLPVPQNHPLPVAQNHVGQFQNIQMVQITPLNTYPQFNVTVPQLVHSPNRIVLPVNGLKQKNTIENTIVKDPNNNKSQANNNNDINAIKLNGDEFTIEGECNIRVEGSSCTSNNDNQDGNSGSECKNGANEDDVITESTFLTEAKETVLYDNDNVPDKCDSVTNLAVADVQDGGAMAIYQEDGENKENIAQAPNQQCCFSFDKIMSKLRMKYTGIMDLDLMDSLINVRNRHNNSLSGIPVKVIMEEAEKYILKCQKKYLLTSPTTEKTNAVKTQETLLLHTQNFKRPKPKTSELNKKKLLRPVAGPSIENLVKLESKACAKLKSQRKRLNSAPTDSRENSVKSKAQPSTQAKCPWGQVSSRNDTWNKEYEETECIICMENLQCKNTSVYTLACKHTFHMTCIKNWFQHNQSCPNCRVHCTIDDEYPPLPS